MERPGELTVIHCGKGEIKKNFRVYIFFIFYFEKKNLFILFNVHVDVVIAGTEEKKRVA